VFAIYDNIVREIIEIFNTEKEAKEGIKNMLLGHPCFKVHTPKHGEPYTTKCRRKEHNIKATKEVKKIYKVVMIEIKRDITIKDSDILLDEFLNTSLTD